METVAVLLFGMAAIVVGVKLYFWGQDKLYDIWRAKKTPEYYRKFIRFFSCYLRCFVWISAVLALAIFLIINVLEAEGIWETVFIILVFILLAVGMILPGCLLIILFYQFILDAVMVGLHNYVQAVKNIYSQYVFGCVFIRLCQSLELIMAAYFFSRTFMPAYFYLLEEFGFIKLLTYFLQQKNS